MTITELRRFSAAAFGHRYRLELLAALALADGGPGRLPDAAGGLLRGAGERVLSAGQSDGRRRAWFGDTGRVRGGRRVLYARTAVPVWTGLRRMVEDLAVDVDLAERGPGLAGGVMSSAASLVRLSGIGAPPGPRGRPGHAGAGAGHLGVDRIPLRPGGRRGGGPRAAWGRCSAWDLLDTLMDLPAGLPVPLAALDAARRGGGWPGAARGGARRGRPGHP